MKRLYLLLPLLLVTLVAAQQEAPRRNQQRGNLPGKISGPVQNVKTFHATGDGKTDDTAAFAAALRKLPDTGGTLTIPPGTYVVGDLKIRSGITMIGFPPHPPVVLLKAPNAKTILDISSPVVSNSAALLHDISLQYLTFRGRSVENGFSEHIHNISVAGVERLSMTHVRFEAFQGDGLYLGAIVPGAKNSVHNSEVRVSDSSFDGVNFQNRNGISVIDCTHCVFDRNEFSNVSRADMPGAIDLEPNRQEEVLQDISVKSNVVNSGRSAGICVSVNLPRFVKEPGNISIEDNQIHNTPKGILFYWKSTAPVSQTTAPQVLVQHNLIDNADHAMIMDGKGSIVVTENDIAGSSQGLQLGIHFGISNVRFTNNRFRRVGTNSEHGITISGPVTSVAFEGNTFEDLGSKGPNGSAIHYIRGAAEDLTFTGNVFSSPQHKTKVAMTTADQTAFKPDAKVWAGNNLKDGIQAGLSAH